MKKIKYLFIMLCFIALTACYSDSPDADRNESIDVLPTTEQSIDADVPDPLAALPEVIPRLISQGQVFVFGESLALIDLLTGDILATLELADGADMVVSVFNFDNGDFGALVGVNNPINLYLLEQADDDFDASAAMEEEHDYNLHYLILDDELNILQTLPVVNPIVNDPYMHWATHTRFEDGELFVYYSHNHLFHDGDGETVYRYHVHTNTNERLLETGLEIAINTLNLTESGHILFAGRRLTENAYTLGALTYYGFIDLETETVTYFTEYGFNFNAITSVGSQVLINEGLSIASREDGTDHWTTNRDEIILMNMEMLEQAFVSLPEGGSAYARLMPTGTTFVTITDDLSYFKQYDIIDSTSVSLTSQTPLQGLPHAERAIIFPLTDTIFAIHYLYESVEGNPARWVEIVTLQE
ncbi:MAG: hypothetical protein FWE07_05170 [Turicibacter sp.]|nr:hypothetical protein [Turicibacter sp.]